MYKHSKTEREREGERENPRESLIVEKKNCMLINAKQSL